MSSKNRGVAIVTGAAAGIGRASAKALQSAGYQVFGTSRKAPSCSTDGIALLTCDVTSEESVAQMVAEVIKRAGRIDVLVNNAGSGLIGGAEESSIEQAQALFDVNVFGVLRVTNAVLPIMRRQLSGRIINMSSVLGFVPGPFSALYTSTKHAIEGYSETLDHEVRPFGVRVVLVEPAFTRTSFEQNAAQPDRMMSVYETARTTMTAVWNSAIEAGDAPEVVADAVVEAAIAKVSKLRNPASKRARQLHLLRRFVPASAFDKSLRKQMKLPA